MESKIIKINDLVYQGNGIGKFENKIFFVPFTVPGDLIEVEEIKSKKNFSFGKIKKIIEESTFRINPTCKYFAKCGGCNYQMINYEKECEYKEKQITELFSKFSKIDNIKVNSIISDNMFFYRNQVTFHCDNNFNIGFKKVNSNQIIDIDFCFLLNDKINNIYKSIRQIIKKEKLNISYIKIKASDKTNSLQIIFFIKNKNEIDKIKQAFSKFLNNDLSFIINIIDTNRYKIKHSFYLTEKIIWLESINNLIFPIYQESFFQTNRIITEKIIKFIENFLQSNLTENLYDIYGGLGLFTFSFVDYFNKIYLIEINKDSIASANKIIAEKNITKINILKANLEKTNLFFESNSTIIFDPPRSGIEKNLLEQLVKSQVKQIIYLSCDPATQARDIEFLKKFYNIINVQPFNMFPRTYHIENLVILKIKN